jgi:general secretion pathway protein B
MSYILDALRKADSDRERGAVPGIHTQATPGVSGDERRARSNGPLVWVVLVLSALVVALLAWLLFGREPAPEARPPVVATLPPPVTPMPAPVLPAPPTSLPAPATAPVTRPAKAAPPAPRVAEAPTPRTGVALPAAKPASAEPRIYATSELPENIKRELPQVVVGGSIYSDNPANRFLIINGQVFHEGDKLGPELWLDQIKLKAAVLRYKDYRYTIRF